MHVYVRRCRWATSTPSSSSPCSTTPRGGPSWAARRHSTPDSCLALTTCRLLRPFPRSAPSSNAPPRAPLEIQRERHCVVQGSAVGVPLPALRYDLVRTEVLTRKSVFTGPGVLRPPPKIAHAGTRACGGGGWFGTKEEVGWSVCARTHAPTLAQFYVHAQEYAWAQAVLHRTPARTQTPPTLRPART